jgi:epoxide hydrolase-like predicted phosphatase
MGLRAILFDLGGVILRTEHQAPREHLAERLRTTYDDLAKVVFESESSRMASVGAITTQQHWAAVGAKLGVPPEEVDAVYAEFFAGDILDRELIDFIRSLRQDTKTGLISNAWPDMRDYIEKNRFSDAFDDMVISSEVGLLKPDPRIFELALKRLGVSAAEAALVDDTVANVEAAKAMGMYGIRFTDTAETQQQVAALMD